jgi:hypothetical protein
MYSGTHSRFETVTSAEMVSPRIHSTRSAASAAALALRALENGSVRNSKSGRERF